MSLAAEKIAGHPQFLSFLRAQSRALLQIYNASPRLSGVFATQQRWLLAHAALALFFESGSTDHGQLTLSRFFDLVARYEISSRNTADAFVKEMERYGFVRAVEGEDKRTRPLAPAEEALSAISGWTIVHLSTLDQIDDGRRLARFLATEHALAKLQPAIAEGLLTSVPVRQPQKTFSLFTWLNNGGVIMEWLVSNLGDPAEAGGHIATPVFSMLDMARWLNLSHTHLRRKLRAAEAMGSLGWAGQRGNSAMWVSPGFVNEMMAAQAVKLSIIDAAFEATLGGDGTTQTKSTRKKSS